MDMDDVVVGRLHLRTLQQFAFRVRDPGNYFVAVDVTRFKRVRERTELSVLQKETRLSISLEAVRVDTTKPNITGEELVVNAADLLPAAGVLKKFKEAHEKLLNGDVSEARRQLESLVMEVPDFYEGHIALGETYQQSQRYSEAEREFQIALDLRPHSAMSWIHLGSLYLEQVEVADQTPSAQGGVEGARQALQRAIQLNSQAAFAHYLLGVTYYKLAKWGEAERSLVRALELEPRLGDVRLALAKVYLQVQDLSKARTHLETYLKENPKASGRDRIHNALQGMALVAKVESR